MVHYLLIGDIVCCTAVATSSVSDGGPASP